MLAPCFRLSTAARRTIAAIAATSLIAASGAGVARMGGSADAHAAAAAGGVVTYRLTGGDVYRLAVRGATHGGPDQPTSAPRSIASPRTASTSG